MNVDKLLRYSALSIVAFFGVLYLWASGMRGDSGAGLVLAVLMSIFFWTTMPLCVIGALVSLACRQNVKTGILFGLAGGVGMTILTVAGVLLR